MRAVVLPVLSAVMVEDDDSVREGAARVFAEAGMPQTPSAVGDSNSEETTQIQVLVGLAGDATVSGAVVPRLIETLWQEPRNSNRVWEAAIALAASGHTGVVGLPRALVRAGLAEPGRRVATTDYLRRLMGTPQQEASVRAALQDALEARDDALATAAAVVVLEIDPPSSESRAQYVATTALRDAKQIAAVVPRLRQLIGGEKGKAVSEALRAYLKHDSTSLVAASVADLLANAIVLDDAADIVNILRAALADLTRQDEIVGHFARLLSNPRTVASARHALADALDDDDSNTAWGAVRCLWQCKAYFEPRLVPAIVSIGLLGARHRIARSWLVELLEQPGTREIAIAVLRQRLREYLDQKNPEFDKAWLVAECLVAGNVVDEAFLAKVLVNGGMADRGRHEEVLAMSDRIASQAPSIGTQIREEAWLAIVKPRGEKPENPKRYEAELSVGLGAARLLASNFAESIAPAFSIGGDAERGKALCRVLVQHSGDLTAQAICARIAGIPNALQPLQAALVRLLRESTASVTFGAARWLVDLKNVQHFLLPSAIVNKGFAEDQYSNVAERMIDEVNAAPGMELPVRAALTAALLGRDRDTAWRAAAYLIARGERPGPAMIRGLVYGGLSPRHRQRRGSAQKTMRALLATPELRTIALEGVANALFGEDERPRFNCEAAYLLLCAGVDISSVLAQLSDDEVRWSAAAPLALIALSGRFEETLRAAEVIGSPFLASLLRRVGPAAM